jgi:3'-phosphoadenosine 5'-phosphosulfate sulfotransferase (PAPS reductase)/FAD synthetase
MNTLDSPKDIREPQSVEEPAALTLGIEGKIAKSLAEIDAAVKEWKPIMLVGLFSGGNDSLSCCYVASLHSAFSGILHINTGIGIEQTRHFVRDTCATRNWKLWEYKAAENTFADGTPDPMIYEDIVTRYGFPGPAGHQFMYNCLKERQMRRFERDMGASGRGKNKKRIMFVSGVRIDESARRKFNVSPELIQQVESRRIFVSPVREWSKSDLRECRAYAGLAENQVSKDIHKSGECLCGAFAKPEEFEELKFFYPEAAAEIARIAEKAKAHGHNWGWGQRPPKKCKAIKITSQPLCTSCNLANL